MAVATNWRWQALPAKPRERTRLMPYHCFIAASARSTPERFRAPIRRRSTPSTRGLRIGDELRDSRRIRMDVPAPEIRLLRERPAPCLYRPDAGRPRRRQLLVGAEGLIRIACRAGSPDPAGSTTRPTAPASDGSPLPVSNRRAAAIFSRASRGAAGKAGTSKRSAASPGHRRPRFGLRNEIADVLERDAR
jgi:hypothetical protein